MVPSQFGGDDRIVLLFPGALGDFLCFAAALAGLRRATPARLAVAARGEWAALLDEDSHERLSIDGRAVAELFGGGEMAAAREAFAGAAAIHSWTGHGDRNFERRLRSLAPEVALHPFRSFAPGEHARAYYARCLGVTPSNPDVALHPGAVSWAAAALRGLPSPLLAVHAGSGTARKNWAGMGALARWWRNRGGGVVWIEGPAETGAAAVPPDAVIVREGLPRVAAVLAASAAYAGNDSGISHLAAALAVPGVALFGASDPVHWRPHSPRLRVVEASGSCAVCAVGICPHRLPLGRVAAALLDLVPGGRP